MFSESIAPRDLLQLISTTYRLVSLPSLLLCTAHNVGIEEFTASGQCLESDDIHDDIKDGKVSVFDI